MLTSEFSAWLSARKTRGFRQWVGNRTPEQAWDECDRADWLLWWAAEAGSDFDTVLRCTCACVRRCISVSTDLRIPAVIEAVEAGIESLEDAARNAALVSYEATGRGLSGKAKAAYAAHLLAIAAIDKKPERFAEAVSAAAESLAARYAIRERAVA